MGRRRIRRVPVCVVCSDDLAMFIDANRCLRRALAHLIVEGSYVWPDYYIEVRLKLADRWIARLSEIARRYGGAFDEVGTIAGAAVPDGVLRKVRGVGLC